MVRMLTTALEWIVRKALKGVAEPVKPTVDAELVEKVTTATMREVRKASSLAENRQ